MAGPSKLGCPISSHLIVDEARRERRSGPLLLPPRAPPSSQDEERSVALSVEKREEMESFLAERRSKSCTSLSCRPV